MASVGATAGRAVGAVSAGTVGATGATVVMMVAVVPDGTGLAAAIRGQAAAATRPGLAAVVQVLRLAVESEEGKEVSFRQKTTEYRIAL